uniref:thyroid adenoma-associated protein homolog isoform X2 n=1 Tax=Ciona intestinalis TaxID=7719 RepID=UPI00089DD390|nr:thyroid adenoma-associated protein homolog isoform X2 [Ciona intestinalis]|eukprot:XP_018666712.1 thyroid adenoma-associated protein homolog isoform X2 [Ciona intestinalis]
MNVELQKLKVTASKLKSGDVLQTKNIVDTLILSNDQKEDKNVTKVCGIFGQLMFLSVNMDPSDRKQLLKHVKACIPFCGSEFTQTIDEQIRLLFPSKTVLHITSVWYLSVLIEEMKISQKISFKVIQHVLPCIVNGLCDSELDETKLYYFVKLLLQILQHFRSDLTCVTERNDIETLGMLSTRCIEIMVDSKTEYQDLMQMCATVLGYMLSYFKESKKVSKALTQLLKPQALPVEVMPKVFMDVEIPNTNTCSNRMVWCLCGIMKCCKPCLIFEDTSTLLLAFHYIESFCATSTEFLYQGFIALLIWWKCSAKLVKSSECFYEIFVSEGEVLSKSLDLIWKNWDNPISGVPDIMVQVFSLLLDLNNMVNGSNNLPSQLCDQLVSSPVFVKGKYGLLQILVSKYGADIILKNQPTFLDAIIPCLSANHTAPVVSKVYKAIILSTCEASDSREFDLKVWEKVAASSLIKALLSPDPFTRQQALHFWLPVNISLHANVFDKTVCLLKPSTTYSDEENSLRLFATIGVMKAARNNHIVTFQNMDHEILKQSLKSFDNETRGLAFAVVCGSKQSEVVTDVEFSLLRDHIHLNLNSDSSTFRHEFNFAIRQLLIRVQCTLIASIKQNTEQSAVYVDKCLSIIVWLKELCLSSLQTSASYQRKQTVLTLYDCMLGLFALQKKTLRKVLVTPADFQVLVTALQKQKLNLLSQRLVDRLLCLLEDSAPDIREFCLNLLLQFPTSHAYINWNKINSSFMQLLSSPKFPVCDSGCLLTYLYLQNICADKKKTSDSAFDFIKDILYKNVLHQFDLFKLNPLKASQSSPMFGWISALSKCIGMLSTENEHRSVIHKKYLQKVCLLILDILNSTENIISWMLVKIFGCIEDADAVTSADFQEISKRINQLVQQPGKSGDNVLLTLEHEAILSCSWLTLKHCCSLMTSASSVLIKATSVHLALEAGQYKDVLYGVCDVFVRVLSTCRHRGVIESCFESFNALCVSLYSSSQSQYMSIPSSVLKTALAIFKNNTVVEVRGGTTTRRSAGIPLIAEAVLSSAVASLPSHKKLLKSTMTVLLNAARASLDTGVKDTADMPQVHALYIMRHLFRNTSLGPNMAEYLSQSFILAINSLRSSVWVIRNAATHLLGAVSCRMLGQKHTEDRTNFSSGNSLTITEFFSRFPDLLEFIASILNCNYLPQEEEGSKLQIRAEVHPILSVLSKLTCPVSSGNNNESSVEIMDALITMFGSPSYSMRRLAVMTVLSIAKTSQVQKFTELYWKSLPCDEIVTSQKNKPHFRQNELHSWLILTLNLMDKYTHQSTENIDNFLQLLYKRTWLMDLKFNSCPFTASLYIKLTRKVYDIELTQNLKHLYMVSKTATKIVTENNSVWIQSVGYSKYVEESTLLSLHLTNPVDLHQTIGDLGKCVKDDEHTGTTKHYLFQWLCNKVKQKNWINVAKYALLSLWCTTDTNCTETNQTALLLFTTMFQDPVNCIQHDEFMLFQSKLLSLHESTKILSIQCGLIKGLSVLIFQMILCQKCVEDTVLNIWVDEIYKHTSTNKAPEPLRLVSATGLQIAGKNVLAQLQLHANQQQVMKKVGMILTATLSHLQDEQPEIRSPACAFVTHVTQHDLFIKLHHNTATEGLLQVIIEQFPSDMQVVSALISFMCDVQVPKHASDTVDLFEQEEFNLYLEPDYLGNVFLPCIKELMDAIIIIPQNWIKTQLELAAHRMEQLLKCIENLREKAYLRFMMCTLHYVKVVLHACKLHLGKNLYMDFGRLHHVILQLSRVNLSVDQHELVQTVLAESAAHHATQL